MKQIKGKKYYICIGYIDPEKTKNGLNIKDIDPIFMDSKDNTTVYVDDSDKDNVVTLPLISVNEIQKRGDTFKFRVLIHPRKIQSEDGSKKINIIGLFSKYKKDNMEIIKNVSFYSIDRDGFEKCDYINKYDRSRTYSIEAGVDKILEDK